MEAHEALVAGVLGLAALYAHHRRGDPLDRILALGALWICVTGIAGLPLALYGTPPWTFIRLALRLTGPPLLLIICEEAVRTKEHPGSRKTSIGFAVVIWIAAVGGMIWAGGGAMFDARLDFIMPLQLGITAWMAMLAVTLPAAIMTLVSGGFRRLSPGLAGIIALLLIASEAWAAVDTRWGSGAIDVGISITYRNLFTLALAGLALAKAFLGWRWLFSAASADGAPKGPYSKEKSSEKSHDGSSSVSEDESVDDRDKPRPARGKSRPSKAKTNKKKGKKRGRK